MGDRCGRRRNTDLGRRGHGERGDGLQQHPEPPGGELREHRLRGDLDRGVRRPGSARRGRAHEPGCDHDSEQSALPDRWWAYLHHDAGYGVQPADHAQHLRRQLGQLRRRLARDGYADVQDPVSALGRRNELPGTWPRSLDGQPRRTRAGTARAVLGTTQSTVIATAGWRTTSAGIWAGAT